MYAVLYKEERTEHDPYDKDGYGYRVKVDKFEELKDEQAVLEWVRKNDTRFAPIKEFKILKYEVLTVTKTVNFDLQSSG